MKMRGKAFGYLPMVGICVWMVFVTQITDLNAQAASSFSLKDVLPGDEFRDYEEEDYHDRIEIIRKAIERNVETLKTEFKARNLEVVFQKLERIKVLSHVALEESERESDPDELRDNEVKKLEILVRKLGRELEDFKRTLPLNQHQTFDQAIEVLDDLRSQLFDQLFARKRSL